MLWQAFGRWGGIAAEAASGGPTPTLEGNGGLAHNADSSSSVLVAYPAGVAENDIAFLHALMHDSTTVNSLVTPSGWNVVDTEKLDGTGVEQGVYWKRLDGSETGTVEINATSAHQATDCLCGVISVWRGCKDTGTPYEGLANNTGTGTSMSGAAVTTSGVNRRVLNFCACADNTLSSAGGSYSEDYDLTTDSGADGGLKLYSIERPGAGSHAGTTHTLAASELWQVMSIALIPA